MQFKNSNMFYLFRKAHLLQLFAGVVVLLLCGVEIFVKHFDVSALNDSLPCMVSLSQWLTQHPLAEKFFFLFLLLIQAALIFNYVRRSGFLDEENVLSILFFCVFSLGMGILLPPSPAWFTNTAILIVLNLVSFSAAKSRFTLLFAGIVLGTASLFDLTAVLLTVFFLLYVLINQIDKLRDLLATLCGLILPYLYLLAYHYIAGTFPKYFHSLLHPHLFFPFFTQSHLSVYTIVAMALMLLLTIYVMVRLKVLYNNKLIVVRKRLLFLCILFCFNIAMLLVTNTPFPYSLSYLLIPVTVLTISFIPTRNFAISTEILLSLLTASLVVMARM